MRPVNAIDAVLVTLGTKTWDSHRWSNARDCYR